MTKLNGVASPYDIYARIEPLPWRRRSVEGYRREDTHV